MELPAKQYALVYADPPWRYPSIRGISVKDGKYVSRNPCGADAHYPLMTDNELTALPVRGIMRDKAALFMWATCPRLDFAVNLLQEWGLHYRGVAYVWVKTNMDGRIMGAKGPKPAFVKPNIELCLVATTIKRGRVFPIHDYKQRQVVMEPRGAHSRKPAVVRDNIAALCGDVPRIELFARGAVAGWDTWGLEAGANVAQLTRLGD